jgi:hypothetical protein
MKAHSVTAITLVSLIIALPALSGDTGQSVSGEEVSSLNLTQIVAKMVEQSRMQEQAVKSYRVMRRFEASNPRFKVAASLSVLTTFHQPDRYESQVTAFEGSNFIRNRVFNKILDAEKEVSSKQVSVENNILPENYTFASAGMEMCGDRKCHKLAIHPKRKSKYLLEGFIWLDGEDYGIVRIKGSPSKRLSFWTLRTTIERRYENRAGIWMTAEIKSTSDLVIAGTSALSIAYEYLEVEPISQSGMEASTEGR